MIKEQFYGVEIEITGITRAQAAHALAELFNSTPEYSGGSYVPKKERVCERKKPCL